jgi:hypothetical protein
MASTCESKKEGSWGGRRHEPPTEEERRQREAEFKQEFLDEYRKRYGDELISAEQTWELYQVLEERWHAKMKERRHQAHHGSRSPPHHGSQSPPRHDSHSPPRHGSPRRHFEEKRKQVFAELHQDFQKDFTAAHGTDKINVDQAWSLIQKVKQAKFEKWQAGRQKHGQRHGPGDHERHSPPANEQTST